MGTGKSHEIIEYRKNIMRFLCSNTEIIKLFGLGNEENPEDIIPYKYSYPHEFIPEVITSKSKYINFDISASRLSSNDTFKNMYIYMFVFCHKDSIRYIDNGREYLWYDKATCCIDDMISGTSPFGIGKIALVQNVPYNPHNDFKGRQLTFELYDWTDGKKYGRN